MPPLTGIETSGTVYHAQSGQNKAGLHDCWHRTYSPFFMRWTSADPAASPWWNLMEYCGTGVAMSDEWTAGNTMAWFDAATGIPMVLKAPDIDDSESGK